MVYNFSLDIAALILNIVLLLLAIFRNNYPSKTSNTFKVMLFMHLTATIMDIVSVYTISNPSSYPMALFKSAASIQGLDDYRVADEDEIYVYGRIAVLPIGLFLLHENGFEKLDRQLLERDVAYLMEKLRKGESDCNFTYLMEARKDVWLY